MTDVTTLLHHVARGVNALSDRDSAGPSVPPYPDESQYALDLVVRDCLDHERTPPAGIPELIRWCTDLTAQHWPAPFGPAYGGLALVDPVHRTRTRACAELAGLAAVADEIMTETLADLSDGEAAERLRFLQSHVLVGPDTQRKLFMENPREAQVVKFVKPLYRPASAAWIVRGRVALCDCGLPARTDDLAGEDVRWCERETCPPGGRTAQRFPAARVLLLHPALRLFVTLPSTLDIRVLDGFTSTGVPVRTVDRPTQRREVCFPGKDPLTFRSYDRLVPSALALDATADGVDVAVIPDGSAMAAPAARQAFADNLPPGSRVVLATESELLAGALERNPDA
ncbi:hypothetical protein [Amycolatopsis sp. NPDC004625]|uniref:pPIWI_RE_Y domain-containing protein n=1 Tax=Amycolatopsis sp. NPDC004625 TaxID=3154670 RepID=UPI0033A77851